MPSLRTATGEKPGRRREGEPRVRRPAARHRPEPLAEGGFVFRRCLAALAATLVAFVLVPTAAAVRVKVRVEGKSQTIFNAAETNADVQSSAPLNALDALDWASIAGEFYYHVSASSFGNYVDQIGRFPAAGQTGWVFKVNGASPPVGADRVELKDGDRVLWYWATFGPTGGPPTLLLTRTGRNCYRVVAENDAGADRAAAGAVLNLDGRRVRTRAGRACVGRHRGSVRATLAGAVRSNAL